jgi:ATP-dependent Lon protease
VREKLLAAKNFGLSRVILPKGNEPEVAELKADLVAGLDVLYVDRFDQVFELLFGAQTGSARGSGRKAPSKPPPRPRPGRR